MMDAHPKKFLGTEHLYWLVTPGQAFVLPVQYRPDRTVVVPQMETSTGPVTGAITVTPAGDVTCSGRARDWILLASDLRAEEKP